MKKAVCILLVFCLLFSSVCALADSQMSDGFETALISVKQKVNVPEHLTEFSTYSHENSNEGETNYVFVWETEKGDESIEVSTDEKGRINRYYSYDGNTKSQKKLTSLSKADIISVAEDFLKKIIPETFNDGDTLVPDAESWSANELIFSLNFVRIRDSVKVKNNNVSVRLQVEDDVACVRSANVFYDYDAQFEPTGTEAEDIDQKYREAYPPEMVYLDEYEYDAKDNTKTALIYRFKDSKTGYILASTGEAVTEDELFGYNESNKDMMSGSAMGGTILTDKELEELEKIEGVISESRAKNIIKSLPYVRFESTLRLTGQSVTERDGNYILTLEYSDTKHEKYLSASFDGATGEVRGLYNRMSYEQTKDITDSEKKKAEKATAKFLSAVAGDKLESFVKTNENIYSKTINTRYDRVVNDIRYIGDTLSVSFDAGKSMVINYSIDFEPKRIFASPEGALTPDDAYPLLLAVSPLEREYVSVGGVYKVCFFAKNGAMEIDAFTGEKYAPYFNDNRGEYSYTDIDGHWAQEAINKLAEVQIGFAGDTFRPDEAISQYDLLRLFGAGIRNKYYIGYNEESLYRLLIEQSIIEEEQKNPQGNVTREDAFVFMIRFAELEEVAKLEAIFNVNYDDSDLISEGKRGYPAILTGMGVISGNGGKIRPTENITRAEAVTMLYNYMLK